MWRAWYIRAFLIVKRAGRHYRNSRAAGWGGRGNTHNSSKTRQTRRFSCWARPQRQRRARAFVAVQKSACASQPLIPTHRGRGGTGSWEHRLGGTRRPQHAPPHTPRDVCLHDGHLQERGSSCSRRDNTGNWTHTHALRRRRRLFMKASLSFLLSSPKVKKQSSSIGMLLENCFSSTTATRQKLTRSPRPRHTHG